MNRNAFTILICLILMGLPACKNSVERDADRLIEMACAGSKTTDEEEKEELHNQFREFEKKLKVKHRGRDADILHLYDLYFAGLKDCLGYIPVK
ncbi:hypothetical protein SAMN05216327_10258 [Dyadobacter sp. SG02]|uniref:hypothetical protein n=1 Tax=Dyadobacter sp. SG02 TaxID=1855291 RepID=UPI0008BA21C6|nr:hypothetical protein [Dyadobacter sp. SG02]SEI50040.1 hypothetical protein SAMN05216327_10258 [Dyadobacter sp. SG02]